MTDPAPTPSFAPGRRLKIAANVGVSALAFVALVLMTNFLAARHFRRFQWSSDPRVQLSPTSVEVLHSVTNKLKVIVFFDRTKPLYDLVADLLEQYQLRCPLMELEYVDYERSLGRASLIQAEYGAAVGDDADRIIFDDGRRKRVVYAKELSEFDYNAVLRGKEVKRTGFKGEELFTSAIYSLINSQPAKVYFLQGHGEHDPAAKDDSGYSKFVQILQENQVEVTQLAQTALLSREVPSDCQLLVVAGPVHPLEREELSKIEQYLSQGGRMLALFNFNLARQYQPCGLEKVLTGWGVEVGRNLVYDAAEGQAGDVQKTIVTRFAPHPITNPLARSRILMILPRSVGRRASDPQGADAPKVTELATTSQGGMAVKPDGKAERQQVVLPLMVAVEKGAIQGITADRGATRLVVTGDSFFLSNAAIDQEANRDFARAAVNWLLNRDLLVQGIGSRPVREYRISMTNAEMSTVRWLFLAGFPGGALFLGFVVWLRRRS